MANLKWLPIAAILIGGVANSSAESYFDTVMGDDPLGFWQLNGNANDSSGNGHNGTVNGAVSFAGSGGAGNTGSAGAQFSGGDISINSWAGFPSDNSMSIELWYEESSRPTLNQTSDFLSTGSDTTPGSWQFFDSVWGEQAGLEDFDLTNPYNNPNSGGSVFLNDPGEGAVGEWHQLVATVSGSTGTTAIYIDGQLSLLNSAADSNPYLPRLIDHTGLPLIMGLMPGVGYNYSGLMSDVSIYNYALDGTQVHNHYEAGIPGSTPEPVTTVLGFAAVGLAVRRRKKARSNGVQR